MAVNATSGVAATTVRGVSAGAFISLVAAAVILILQALRLPNPTLMLLIAALTFNLALVALYSANLVLKGKRHAAIGLIALSIGLISLLPSVRFLPGIYLAVYNLNMEALFPPLWPYSVAFPLLCFLLLEIALPSRRETEVPLIIVLLLIISSVVLLFLGAIFIKALTPWLLLQSPLLNFNALAACLALAFLLILGAVLPRKGMIWEGAALLLLVGLLLEGLSTFFYRALPSFVEVPEGVRTVDRLVPIVPLLGGTVTGSLAALTGALLMMKALMQEPVGVPLSQASTVPQFGFNTREAQALRLSEPQD